MNATLPSKKLQQRRVNRHSATTDNLDFFNLLTSPALFEQLEAVLPEHRERLFPPAETLSLFLTQVMNSDQSCQQIVNQTAIRRITMGLPVCSTHTGAYCRARQRLPSEMIQRLTRFLGNEMSAQTPDAWRWRDRRVLLVDGTTVTMPDTRENQRVFPQQGSQLPGLGFPICRIVGITCLGSGVMLNAAIGKFNGKGSGERGLLRSLQDTFQSGEVLLGDAFYATYFFMAEMIARGVDLLLEQDGSRCRVTDFRRGHRLGCRDIEDNLLDLVMYGFTVVPPEKMGASDLTPRLRDAILEVYERRSGHSIDNWKTYDGKLEKFQSWGWLLENDVFLEAIHNPVYQTIGQFLTGKSGFLAGAAVILKTQDQERDGLIHSDSHGVPSPWPSFATYANLSWLLTDYLSREDGPTVLVPGSHRDRMPRGNELSAHVKEHDYIKPIPLEGLAGSLAVWNGAMWHGSVRRTKPGMRITLVNVWQRVFMRPVERVKEISPEHLERWPDLPRLLGYERIYPYQDENTHPERVKPTVHRRT